MGRCIGFGNSGKILLIQKKDDCIEENEMIGIESFGAYVPIHRLTFEDIGKAWGVRSGKGERSVAAEDEDSLTMAVEAAVDCLGTTERKTVDGVIFASTTSPFLEKQAAVLIGQAVDFPREISTLDCSGSLRAGTGALMTGMNSVASGNNKKVLVTTADCRIGQPGTPFEYALGDGGAAFLIGNEDPVVRFVGSYSLAEEITDYWRRSEDKYVHFWEERFAIGEGVARIVPNAVEKALNKFDRRVEDIAKFISNAPNEKTYWGIAKRIGFDLTRQVLPPHYATMGNTGAAFGPMQLVSCLENAKPKDLILFANFGNGCDVLLMEVVKETGASNGRRGMSGYLASKKKLRNYNQYAIYRGILPGRTDRMPPILPSSTIIWRDQKSLLQFHGMKCNNCGHVQYPIHRVCSNCSTTDEYQEVRLSDQNAKVFSCTVDNLGYGSGKTPFWAIADFPDVRVRLQIADAELAEVNVGDMLEMTFRKLPSENDIPVYGWKARRIR
jgi:3-hydroxy-3-methylglutaryl CoA synthase